ncbi:MAG: aspartate carbamoyltransferase catalytic subunit [Proteobacteria bacterium]|nr:aspartate carbamoyltransferase catalytic subunit [Pseudomonadota bacterium]
MKHLIDIKDLSAEEILDVFSQTLKIKNNSKKKNSKILRGKTIANLFFENSTRTLVSFELAAKRLGARVVNVNISNSSTTKGEALKDTIQTLEAMQIDAFIVRHSENEICQKIKTWLKPKTFLINAGDGNNQHPTQALLDVFTVLQHKKNIEDLKITIIGDIKHSRVANSLIDCLHILGNNTIHLFGPQLLLPTSHNKAIISTSMQEAIDSTDVIVMLRIQKERIKDDSTLELNNYHENFGLNKNTLACAKPNCVILHPGPINRELEISSEIAESTPSVILEQVQNGVLIRQAVLKLLFKAN